MHQNEADLHRAVSDHHVHVDGHLICPCGQELDACRRAHCPRCGLRVADVTPRGANVA